jgi:hypothetical protein
MSSRSALHSFDQAMNRVYGNFDVMSEQEAENWSPPQDPGAGGHRGRYLWTDAFGVVNFITLHREACSSKYLTLAGRLVDTVHDVLGRTRDGSARLPGATDEEPLKGGLRIGKMSASGSDGDGQYHHYLTLWVYALSQLSVATGVSKYNQQAIQLAKAIHPHFVLRRPSGDLRMVWKISTDMQHVLVPSEGHLDAATGFVIFRIVQETAAQQGDKEHLLRDEISDYHQIMSRKGAMAPSGDMLDLGMGLWICHFFDQEDWSVKFGREALQLAQDVLSDDSAEMKRPSSRRLAFREFGACLGLRCSLLDESLNAKVAKLMSFWEKQMGEHGRVEDDLRPISQVMYAAALIPGGKCNSFHHDNW